MNRRQRPTYATRAEYEADTTWYWEREQVTTVVGTIIVALGVFVAAYLLS